VITAGHEARPFRPFCQGTELAVLLEEWCILACAYDLTRQN
jgi:hypothetical protein